MKLSILTLTTLSGLANAALPPGYEDEIWCPHNACEMYTNPYGYDGGRSSFSKCYSPSTDETTDGIWTGYRTNITAPDDYVEPEYCTASEYSQCDSDADCSLSVDSTCRCYVSSYFHPFFPEMQYGERCTGDECDNYEAACIPGSNGEGGYCEIRWTSSDDDTDDETNPIITDIPTPSPVDRADTMLAPCASPDDCYAHIRSKAPPHPTSVGLCDCYATSGRDIFDECEGNVEQCRVARCSEDSCAGFEAHCDVAPNDNAMGSCQLVPASSPPVYSVF